MKTPTIGLCGLALVLGGALAAALPVAAIAADRQAYGNRLETPYKAAPADEINVSGQLHAGIVAYEQGNYSEAFRLFRNISALGVTEAHFRLGMMYAEGIGTRKSPRQAAYWLKLAAGKNYPGATEMLATINAAENAGMQANFGGF